MAQAKALQAYEGLCETLAAAVRRCEQMAPNAEAAERIRQAGGGVVSFWKAALPQPLYEGALAAADELCVDFDDGGSHQAPSALMLCCQRHSMETEEEESGVGVGVNSGGPSDESEQRAAMEPLVELLRSLAETADADESEVESEGEVDADGGDDGEDREPKKGAGESDHDHETSGGPPPSDSELLAGARSLLPSFQGRALFLHCARFEQVAPPDANCSLVFDGPGLTARVVTTRAVRAGEQLTLPGDDG